MKKILLTFALFLVANSAQAKITIFACEPEWGSLARAIVRDAADIDVAITENQNAQTVDVKTVLVNVARKAEMVFCSGGGLEDKWLSALINRSSNLAAISNENSLMLAANYVAKPIAQKGARVHLSPYNILTIAAEFTRRVKLLDPIHATLYQKNHDEFAKKWKEQIPKWEKKAAPLKGLKFMANDNSWGYLSDWLGLNIETIIDSKTGAKPDVLRLHAIADNLKTNPVEAIIFAGWEDKRSILWLRDTAKARVVSVPFTTKGPTDLFKLFDVALNALLTDCSSGACKTLAKPESTKVILR